MRDIKKLTPMTDDIVTKIEVAYNKGYDDGFKDGLKEKQDIRIGDEVYYRDSEEKSVVVSLALNNRDMVCMSKNGRWWSEDPKKLRKTGKHYPEIVQVLAALGGDQDDEV